MESKTNMKKIFILLLIALTNTLEAQVLFESFEEWNDSFGILEPEGWEAYPEIDALLLNIERVDSLNDGDYSARLKSNVPGLEGNRITTLTKELPFWPDLVKIKFTYRCIGEGECQLYLLQNTINSAAGNEKLIWQVEAGDSMIYTVTLDSVEVSSPPFDVFKEIILSASPVIKGVGKFGVCEFTVDSLEIEGLNIPKLTSVIDLKFDNQISVFPNPVRDELNLSLPKDVDIQKVELSLFNSNGFLLKKKNGVNNMKLTEYPSGLYYLHVKYFSESFYKKFVKINN